MNACKVCGQPGVFYHCRGQECQRPYCKLHWSQQVSVYRKAKRVKERRKCEQRRTVNPEPVQMLKYEPLKCQQARHEADKLILRRLAMEKWGMRA